jgi:uncharacterized protein (TIGR03083 family)
MPRAIRNEIPTEPPFDAVALLVLERRRLLDVLASLGESDWDRPTRCPGWSVLDVASHLLGDDLDYIAGHRDGYRGAEAPAAKDETGFITWLDALQADWVRATRRLCPALVVALLAWTGPQVVDTIAAEDPTERAASVSWASTEAVPRWLDHARELTERWIHRQQIIEALDRPVDLRPDLALPVLDALRWAFPFRLAAHIRPPGSAIAVAVDGTAPRWTWTLTSSGDRWTFGEPVADGGARVAPDLVVATVTMTEDQAWRLLSNNLDVAVHGRPATGGDPELVATLLGTRAIISRPNPLS